MSSSTNDLFKFISLRELSEDISIDPGEAGSQSQVLERLRDVDVNPATPQPDVLARLKDIRPLSAEKLRGLALDTIAPTSKGPTPRVLDSDSASLAAYASGPAFPNEYRLVYDSWLVTRLRRLSLQWGTELAPELLNANQNISKLLESYLL